MSVLIVVIVLVGWRTWETTAVKRSEVLAATTTKTLEERVASLESRVYVLEKNAGLVSSGKTAVKETYVNLTGGDISSFDWSKINGTDFTLDTSLYGKTVEVSWQGWLSGAAGVRLYDSTNHRVVDFSEFSSTNDGSKSFYSKVMSIWRGQNQYYIEGKITNGTVTVSSPRLKIVTK